MNTPPDPQHLNVSFDLKTGDKVESLGVPSQPGQNTEDLFSFLGGMSSAMPYVRRASHWQTHKEGQDAPRFHAPYHELYLIDKGKGAYEINGETLQVEPDDILFLKPNDMHRYLDGSAYSYFSIHFTFAHAEKATRSRKQDSPFGDEFFRFLSDVYPRVHRVHLVHSGPVREILGRLVTHVRKPGVGSELIAGLLLVEALVYIARSMLFTQGSGGLRWGDDEQIKRRDELMVHQIMAYINENYAEDVNPSALFLDYYLHPNYCRNIFKQIAGTSVSGYLLQRRMAEARRLIEETEDKLAVVADRVGITDYSYFMRAFRKHFGVSPGSLRKERRMPRRG